MKFSNLAMAIGLMASHAVAKPIDDSEPLASCTTTMSLCKQHAAANKLRAVAIAKAVERGELIKASEVSEVDKRACAACGVYLCSGKNFTGECYWGCYPARTLIEIDSYWRTHIASVGPDPGCYCTIGTPYVDKSLLSGY